MRPIEKYKPGNPISIKGELHIIKPQYDPYKEAKPVLLANIGNYCSYCECRLQGNRDIHVEHVQPKSKPPYMLTDWSNFLLSCSTCNGADNKGDKSVVIGNCHLPHLNNTFMSLEYMAGGVVRVNPQLEGFSRQNAENLIQLVGLDKSPKSSKSSDNRWHERSKVWDLAQRYLVKYRSGAIPADVILDLAKAYGHWSIWFTVFKGCDDILIELLNFKGTDKKCFDISNHCAPLLRNPDNMRDKV